jgi:phospholipid/cholesterol/gamma-HCH transport system substrate-binding protein
MSDRRPFRYTHEAVGALVLLALLIFAAAVLQTGRLRNWFEPTAQLKVILPDKGLFGLSRGAKVEILGTQAGTVEQIVVVPGQEIHAVVKLKEKMTAFVRRDSGAIIRKEFGVAGASLLEITRGQGEPLDWDYAVINAVAERAPTESMGELLSEVRAKVLPTIDETQRLLVSLNTITGLIAAGEGAIGRLLKEDRLARELETLLSRVNTNLDKLPLILTSLQKTVGNLATLSTEIAKQSGEIPEITRDAAKVLKSLEMVMQDLSRTTPQLPKMIESVSAATSDVPVLLGQTQLVLYELELLLQRLRSSWLLGGGSRATPGSGPIPAREVTP